MWMQTASILLFLGHLAATQMDSLAGCPPLEGMTCQPFVKCLASPSVVHGRCNSRSGLCCQLKNATELDENVEIPKPVKPITKTEVPKSSQGLKQYINIMDIIQNVIDSTSEKATNVTATANKTAVNPVETESNNTKKENHNFIEISNDILQLIPGFAEKVKLEEQKAEAQKQKNEDLIKYLNTAPNQEICGKRVERQGRITGGRNAKKGDWPWQVFLLLQPEGPDPRSHMCGAAIVDKKWLITAAHCLQHVPLEKMRITIGATDLVAEDSEGDSERVYPKEVIRHPQYNDLTLDYDIALIRLNKSIEYRTNVLPICLSNEQFKIEGTSGTITGWGRHSETGESTSQLQEAEVPLMTNKECEEMFLQSGRKERLLPHFLCAGYSDGRMDSCEGDSGGPLMIEQPIGEDGTPRWTLAGVSSWGTLCGHVDQPGVYTRTTVMSHFLNTYLTLNEHT